LANVVLDFCGFDVVFLLYRAYF